MQVWGLWKFGAYGIGQLQGKHVAAYCDARLQAARVAATVMRELNGLSHVFDVAVRDVDAQNRLRHCP